MYYTYAFCLFTWYHICITAWIKTGSYIFFSRAPNAYVCIGKNAGYVTGCRDQCVNMYKTTLMQSVFTRHSIVRTSFTIRPTPHHTLPPLVLGASKLEYETPTININTDEWQHFAILDPSYLETHLIYNSTWLLNYCLQCIKLLNKKELNAKGRFGSIFKKQRALVIRSSCESAKLSAHATKMQYSATSLRVAVLFGWDQYQLQNARLRN